MGKAASVTEQGTPFGQKVQNNNDSKLK